MAIEEPYEYRQRLTLPKYLVNATGDQFFLPDSWRFYYDSLPGAKALRYVPNATIRCGHRRVALGAGLVPGHPDQRADPQFSWTSTATGRSACDEGRAGSVTLWQATNPGSRELPPEHDRREVDGHPGEAAGERRVRRQGAEAVRGFTAYMVEVTFPSGVAQRRSSSPPA